MGTERFPLMAIRRLRMGTDGSGVTTLVAAAGCPLRCRYCLNPQSWDGRVVPEMITAEDLLERVRIDSLYFIATGGGITFGGGEPLLNAAFLREFRALCPREWRIFAETSLAVPPEELAFAIPCVDHYFADVKDTDPEIFRAYTGSGNAQVMTNLRRLLGAVGPERITVRLPLIPGFNSDRDRDRSEESLRAMGLRHFDRFEYRIDPER